MANPPTPSVDALTVNSATGDLVAGFNIPSGLTILFKMGSFLKFGAYATGAAVFDATGALVKLADSAGWMHNDGFGALAWSTPTAANVGAEPALGNPGVTGYVLSSTTAGVRSWIAQSGGTGANPTANVSNTVVNGSATTYMRSDAAPAIATTVVLQLGRLGLGAAAHATYPLKVAGLVTGGTQSTVVTLDLSSQAGYGASVFTYPQGGYFQFREVSLLGTNDIFLQPVPATTSGYGILEAYNSAGLLVETGGNTNPVIIRTNRVEVARFTGAQNLLVGTTSETGLTGAGGLSVASTTAAGYGVGSALFAGGVYVAGKLALKDTAATQALLITSTSSTTMSADRILTIDVVNADRTLKLSGNAVLNQDVSTLGTPQLAGLGLGQAMNAGDMLSILRKSGRVGFTIRGDAGVQADWLLYTDTGGTDAKWIQHINVSGKYYFRGINDAFGALTFEFLALDLLAGRLNLGSSFTGTAAKVAAPNLPTSTSGLSPGDLWVDTSAGLNIVKRV